MNLDDLLEEFKDEHKNQQKSTTATNIGGGAVKGVISGLNDDGWGNFGDEGTSQKTSNLSGAVMKGKKVEANVGGGGWGDDDEEFGDFS